MERFFVFVGLFFVVIGFVSCGDNEPPTVSHVDERISEGWKEYSAGNYESAVAKFQSALSEDPNSAEAYNGIGWAMARLGQINSSVDSFKTAIAMDPANADAYAGLAGAYLALGDYERAIASAKSVLSSDPKYVSHHDDIDVDNIRVLLAECYYNMGDYASARSQIELLGNFDGALDPSSPTYLTDLLTIIEGLAKKIY